MTLRRARAAVLAVSIITATACGGDEGRDVAPRGPSSARLALRPLGAVDGAPNGYAEYLPAGYGDGKPRPLLVSLHGAGENGNGSKRALEVLATTGIGALIRNNRWPASRPFVVLMPQHEGSDVGGTLCPDTNEIDAFLNFALDRYDIDLRRVYLTGLRSGGGTTSEFTGPRSSPPPSSSQATGTRRSLRQAALSLKCRSGRCTATPTQWSASPEASGRSRA
jgi:poly(3-hydroxybutyrate) depolymerase